jgi:hypothetical protein
MTMYDPQLLLRQIDNHAIPILIGLTVVMICQTIFMVDAVRVSARERVISIPLFCTFFWFAHDLGCVVRFNAWFDVYDNWFLKLFWLGLFSAMLIEFVFFAQAIRYGRKELLPNWSSRSFGLLIVVGALSAILSWEYLRSILSDPLYQAGGALTMLAFPVTAAVLVIRRRSVVGQTVLIWAAFTCMAVAWWATVLAFYGPDFRSWQFIAVGVATILGGGMMTVLVWRQRTVAAGAGRSADNHAAAPAVSSH